MRKIPNKLTKDDERAAAALLLKQNYIHQAAEIGADGILQRQRAGNELRIPVLRSVGVVLLHTERQAMQATRRRWQ